MRLRNTTDVPDDDVREIIRQVRPPGISKFDVMLKNGNGDCGRCYYRGSGYHHTRHPFVVVRLKPETAKTVLDRWGDYHWVIRPTVYPLRTNGGKGYLPCLLLSRREHLVYILAHELRHLWQAKVKSGRRVWGARGQFSERDADAYGIRMVRAYRRAEPEPTPAAIPGAD